MLGKFSLIEKISLQLAKISGKKLIVACSGGGDSVGLLDIIMQNAKCIEQSSLPLDMPPPTGRQVCGISPMQNGGSFSFENIIVAHIHHGLRASADRDEQIVREYCETHELQIEFLRADIKGEARKAKTSIEECARNVRKQWLEEIRKKYEADYIVTAHHRDDQAETLIYRITKGTGITGLGGIEEFSGHYFRPLLGISKQELLEYARKNSLTYGHDETNDDTTIPRNLIRHEILPRLETINPEVTTALSRLSESARELKEGFDEFFEKKFGIITPLLSRGVEKKNENGGFSIDEYNSLPRGFQHEFIRYLYGRTNGSTHGLSRALIEELSLFLSTRAGGKKELGKAWIVKKGGKIFID